MSESSSDLNTSNDEICKSNLSHYSNLNENRTGPVLSRNRRTCHQNCDSGRVSLAQGQDLEQQLSANSFRYLTWHQLEDHEVQGNQLCCPRVREGPPEEELKFRQEEYALPPRKRTPEKGKWQEWLQENWEECLNLNLSFQDLGDPYQEKNFKRILRRLIRVETLWLVDNSLKDLSSIRLPRCTELNISKNHFTSFKQLPAIPQIKYLFLAENHIKTLQGLSDLQFTPLESLILKRNPCEFDENYRQKVFSCLPNLKMLDGVPKKPEDYSQPESNILSKMCTIF